MGPGIVTFDGDEWPFSDEPRYARREQAILECADWLNGSSLDEPRAIYSIDGDGYLLLKVECGEKKYQIRSRLHDPDTHPRRMDVARHALTHSMFISLARYVSDRCAEVQSRRVSKE